MVKRITRRHWSAIPWTLPAVVLVASAGCATSADPRLVHDRTASFYADAKPDEPVPALLDELETGAGDVPEITDALRVDTGDALDVYLRYALVNNPGLRASFDRWRASLERIPQVTALPDPQLTWTYYISEPQTRTGPIENTFTLSQAFPWFGTLARRGDLAAQEAEALWWMVEQERIELMREVRLAYHEYAYLARAIQIARENLSLLKDLEPIVQRRIEFGGNQGDLLRLQVEIGKLENDLVTLQEFRPAISARLGKALNYFGDTLLPWPAPVEGAAVEVEADAARAHITRANPMLKVLQWEIEQAGTEIELAKLQRYPNFTLGFMYTQIGRAVRPVTASGEPGMRPSDSGDDDYGVTIGLSLPIWRKKYAAAVRESQIRRVSTEGLLIQMRNNLLADFERYLYELNTAARQLALYQDTLIPRAQQAWVLTEIEYESGLSSLTDVIDAQQTLLAFDQAYWRAMADYHQRLADIEYLSGGTLP